ncbi:MAG: transferase [Deltaproteobacteria bacterium]|jgi:carbonic anhydrase/acetyltransferase-like protein (isoleucine patch superfamily)|nr:transferase [Deltaproteobacteria bacterium]
MKELKKLLERIIQRININLRELDYDVSPFIRNLVPLNQMVKFYAFYGITPNHPLDLVFRHSSLAGSYFLGKIRVRNSILYKSDIRGDELKHQGDVFKYQNFEIPITRDEGIDIEDSFLIKTLVHNFSHDPETLEKFFIRDTLSTHYANIHGSPCDGCFLGPFATVDLTTMRDCVIGTFSYVQAGEVGHLNVGPGTVWVRSPDEFNFLYRYPLDKLSHYIDFIEGRPPQGFVMDFVEDRKEGFRRVFDVVHLEQSVSIPASASLDRYAVIKPKTSISENVLVAQRAYLQNAWLGQGANAQENCYIINSRLEGCNVTAHGAKIIEADMGKNIFVGFNSFLRGRARNRLTIGDESVVMPHTIIDIKNPLTIPPGHLVWGLITNPQELEANSIALKDLSKIDDVLIKGNLSFEGSGAAFVTAFRDRIHHILEANGAFFDGKKNKGHAQKNQNISFNTIQPYPDGEFQGLYPAIVIQP